MKYTRETLPRIEEEMQEMIPRWKFINWLLMGAMGLLAGRLWYLQILHGEQLRQYSERNRLKETIIPAERGWILDRNMAPLVNNRQDLELTITPQYVHTLPALAKRIAPIIHKKPAAIIKKVREGEKQYGPFYPVAVKKHLNIQQIVRLKALQWDFAGLDIRETIIRHYPLKQNAAHLFGYMGEISKAQIQKLNKKYGHRFHFRPGDLVGKSGLESEWEYDLKGENGFSFVEVDVHNRRPVMNIAGLWSFKPKQPVRGRNLVLTIDKQLQEQTYKSFFRTDKIGRRSGAVVVMKTNGEILSLGSFPSYNPNMFSAHLPSKEWEVLARSPEQPLRNKVIQNHYAPGSVFKPFVALAALQENIITPHTLVHSPARLVFNRRTYHDYRKTGHGLINVKTAIERSANVFFYKLGIELGIDKIAHYARLMKLGQKTNIQLAGEVPGFIPTMKWKTKHLNEPWQEGENLSHAIGQGFTLTTPLQMAVAYNIIATSGKIVKPFIVKKITAPGGEELKIQKPIVQNLPEAINLEYFKLMQTALTQVVHGARGTAKWWKVKGVRMAGKTGTSQVVSLSKKNIYKDCRKRPRNLRHHGWFVAFAPAEQPEIVVAVLTEHSCSGSAGSAPIARELIDFYFNKLKPSSGAKAKAKTSVKTFVPPAVQTTAQTTAQTGAKAYERRP